MSAQFRDQIFPQLEYGLGLRVPHFEDIAAMAAAPGSKLVSWFEAISENYFDDGIELRFLRKLRRDFPVAMHGISLNLGSTDPLNVENLRLLRARVREIEPWAVSDHLCWTGVNGQVLHDLLPLPYTEEALRHFSARMEQVQDYLGRQILIENLSSYLQFEHDEMQEWEFLTELTRRSGCGLLLDINNVYVSSVNHGFDPLMFIRAIPPTAVKQIHLAGHSVRKTAQGREVLIDTHSTEVCEQVWNLYFATLPIWGRKPVMIERDSELPTFAELCRELNRARGGSAGRGPDVFAATAI